MPCRIEQAQAARVGLHDGRVLRMGRGKDALQQNQRAILHRRFNLLSLAVKRIELQSDLRSVSFVIRNEAFNAERHIVEPSRCVQSWSDHETQLIGGRLSEVPARNLQKGVDTRTAASLAYALQTLVYQQPVVVIELHDIRHGA